MPFVPPLSSGSRAAIAALSIALAALAAPCQAHADSLSPDEPTQAASQDDASADAGAETLIAGATALDDRVLARQRGTGPGLMTVAASTQTLQGTQSVTLWDEIAPPAPLPVPADSAHSAQSNAVSYFRQ